MSLPERERGIAPEISQLYFLDTGLPVKYPVWTGLKEELRTEENLFTATPARRPNPIEVFSSARRIVRPIEAWKSMTQRSNPEGLAAAFAVNITTAPLLLTAQTLIATTINTGANMTDPKLTAIVVAAAIGGATYKGIRASAEALRKQRHSATPVGGLAYAITGRPTLSAVAEHAFNYAVVGLLNPLTGYAWLTHNPQFLAEGMAAAPLVLTWCIPANSLIASGKVAEALDPLKQIRETVWQRIKR
jgi:hypothetical protein